MAYAFVRSSWRDVLTSYLHRQVPLVLPRRLRPDTLDTTDLNGVDWPRHFLEPAQHEQVEPCTWDVTKADEAVSDSLGVSWRQMEREEHESSVQAGIQLLQVRINAYEVAMM